MHQKFLTTILNLLIIYHANQYRMKSFWDNYTPDPMQRTDTYASPLGA